VFLFHAHSEKTEAFITPKEKLVYMGDSVEFHCLGIGHMATVKWNIRHRKHLPPHVLVKGSILKIQDVAKRDAGEYVCLVKTTTGLAQDVGKLIVKGIYIINTNESIKSTSNTSTFC